MAKVQVWLTGTGNTSIKVLGMELSQDTPQGHRGTFVTVNGQKYFYIPPEGRWSDGVSLNDFDFDYPATLNAYYAGEILSVPAGTKNPTPSIPGEYDPENVEPVIATVIRTECPGCLLPDVSPGDIVFNLDFEGDFTDSINGFTPSFSENNYLYPYFLNCSLETDPEHVIFGSSSLKFNGNTDLNPAILFYSTNESFVSACMEGSFTFSCFVYAPVGSYFGFLGLGIGSAFPPFIYKKQHVAWSFTKTDGPDYIVSSFTDGILKGESLFGAGLLQWHLQHFFIRADMLCWIDGYQILKGVSWRENFIPPTEPFRVPFVPEPTEITSTGTITVTANPLPGDTLTIKGGTDGDVTFTFVNYYSDNPNEIQIGATVNETAANIAMAINNIFGAEFKATVVDNVITVVAWTPTFSMTQTGDGLTLGAISHVIDGFIGENISADDSCAASDGGKAFPVNLSVAGAIDSLIDGLNENVAVTTSFDCLFDSLEEEISASVSTDFCGLIDCMGAV